MVAKFNVGQRVRIIPVYEVSITKRLKYPELEQYINATGVIVDRDSFTLRRPGEIEPEYHYLYEVQMDKDNNMIRAYEDALEEM